MENQTVFLVLIAGTVESLLFRECQDNDTSLRKMRKKMKSYIKRCRYREA